MLFVLPAQSVAQTQPHSSDGYLRGSAASEARLEAEPSALFGDDLAGTVPDALPDAAGNTGVDANIARALDVGAIAIVGLRAMTPANFADVIAPCVGTRMDQDDLAALTNAIARRAQAEGFSFATAWIAPQRLRNGVIAVEVDEGSIDEIRIKGAAHEGVRRALAPLATGKPVRKSELKRRLLIAGDIDGVRLTGRRYLRENGRGVLVVTVSRTAIAARAVLANDGTREVGREQLTLAADMSGLLASDDSVSLTWSSTPFQPAELQFGRLRYERRLGASGTEIILTGSVALARPGASLRHLQITSRSIQAGMSLLQPVLRRRDRSLWLQADFNLRDLNQTLGSLEHNPTG